MTERSRTHAGCIKFFSLEKSHLSVGVSIAYLFTFQAKPKLIEPLDYENVIVQKKTQILNDCLREMLLFPYDDFQVRVNSIGSRALQIVLFCLLVYCWVSSFKELKNEKKRCYLREKSYCRYLVPSIPS